MDRIEQLQAFLAKRPDDPFPRYALALERRGRGDLAGAIAELKTLLERKAEYVAAYLQLGMLLEQTGDLGQAREVFGRGQTQARAQGDAHALSELTSSLQRVSEG